MAEKKLSPMDEIVLLQAKIKEQEEVIRNTPKNDAGTIAACRTMINSYKNKIIVLRAEVGKKK